MINYHLTIDNSLALGFDSLPLHGKWRDESPYWDAQAAADSIEMKYSEYFKWEGDAQASLSRSIAIGYAEKEMQKYPDVREYLQWSIYDEESREYQHMQEDDDE
jgi:hypothetical protein